ncbi:MAG: bifunctional 2-polyprenyl-6-hydroxyphenol methylase/3-demethylubiquinol 3-O-methyltransferase UbiG [Desulfobacterales bacterium]|nr:bifunctional 2-polyprenyl-6-hydroxyphenol methylase/3-demethylubiquinol 3-O-methyltransferase UbiG [Desulfobacterales bacterium]
MPKRPSNTFLRAAPANVDPAELARFASLSPIWWDRQGAFKALHDINGLRVGYIDERVGLAGKSVLDIGCGGGILAEAMAALGAAVTGIDAGEEPLTVAKHHAQASGLTVDYRRSTAEEFAAQTPGAFDIVTCMELLEHVPHPSSIVAACARLVKPGGDLFFATLNRNPKSWLFAIIGAEYLLGLVPRGTHSYSRLIRPSELQAWCEGVGLSLRDRCGLHYNPFLKRYFLGGNTHVNYLMHVRRL